MINHVYPYEFWFVSEQNAILFEANPLKYIPAFGGHCTHGIASRGDLNASALVDGREAFTCVNTTRWALINGTVYMNSCSMWDDFEKNPREDIYKSTVLWKTWFGDYPGPINDRCFQDGGRWDHVNPIGSLVPAQCVIN